MLIFSIEPFFNQTIGLDNSLRIFAVHKDVQMNMELSQGAYLLTVVYSHFLRAMDPPSLGIPPLCSYVYVLSCDNCFLFYKTKKFVFIKILFSGSVVKKSRARGVKVETLKLPAVTDFAAGKRSHACTLCF